MEDEASMKMDQLLQTLRRFTSMFHNPGNKVDYRDSVEALQSGYSGKEEK